MTCYTSLRIYFFETVEPILKAVLKAVKNSFILFSLISSLFSFFASLELITKSTYLMGRIEITINVTLSKKLLVKN